MKIASKIIQWHKKHGRHHLPWQNDINPYRVWVSEVMLQQTTVQTVLHYFPRFINQFPDCASLAKSDLQEVLTLWSGLGYYRRARYLHQGSHYISHDLKGKWPNNLESLLSIPGVGRSTAGAILSLAMNKRGVILDGNVKRVLMRHEGISSPVSETLTIKRLWSIAESHQPKTNHRVYSQALMDIGATLCHVKSPQCHECPIKQTCHTSINDLWDSIPAKNPRKKAQKISLYFNIVTDGQYIQLEKQPSNALWADTWLPKKAKEQCPHPLSFKHILSHRIITVHPHFTFVNHAPMTHDTLIWVHINDNSIPKSTLLEKCISILKKQRHAAIDPVVINDESS